MFRGSEVRRLVLVSTAFCVLMIVSVTLYLALSSRAKLREQTDNMQTAMAREIAAHLQGCYESMVSFLQSDEGIEFGAGVLELMQDKEALYRFFASTILKTYDADYITIYPGGSAQSKIISDSQPDLQPANLPLGEVPSGAEYAVVGELAGRRGSFLLFEKPGLYSVDRVVYAIDNTSQVESIRQAFEDKKSSMIRQHVVVVAIVFLVLMALSLILIHQSINRYLARPIACLGDKARRLLRGESLKREEVREDSLFANVQRLLNSGGVILEKDSSPDKSGASEVQSPRIRHREVDLVMTIWAAVTALLLAGSTLVLLTTSIAMLNQKADAILDRVHLEMAHYYSACYDSVLPAGQSNADVYIGRDLWKPEVDMERLPSIERFNSLLRDSFDCDVALVHVQPEKGGFAGEERRFISAKKGLDAERAAVGVARMGEKARINRDYYVKGDLVIELMQRTTYPGMGDEQFEYYRIDVTPQAQALEGLYKSGSGALLRNHLFLGSLFLLLCLIFSPLSMAWATRRYITRPILELDRVSARIMEGDLDAQVTVDEKSAFADVARLLEKARSVLRRAEMV